MKITDEAPTHNGYARAFLVILLVGCVIVIAGRYTIFDLVASCDMSEYPSSIVEVTPGKFADTKKFDYDEDGEIDEEYMEAFKDIDSIQMQVTMEEAEELDESASELLEYLGEE
jgi:hypothetical protein